MLWSLSGAKTPTIKFLSLQEFLGRLVMAFPLCSTLCSIHPTPLASAYSADHTRNHCGIGFKHSNPIPSRDRSCILPYNFQPLIPSHLFTISKDVLVKLKCEKEMCMPCNLGCISWDEYRDNSQIGKDGIAKVKVQLELNLATYAKISKRRIHRPCWPEKEDWRKCTLLAIRWQSWWQSTCQRY